MNVFLCYDFLASIEGFLALRDAASLAAACMVTRALILRLMGHRAGEIGRHLKRHVRAWPSGRMLTRFPACFRWVLDTPEGALVPCGPMYSIVDVMSYAMLTGDSFLLDVAIVNGVLCARHWGT